MRVSRSTARTLVWIALAGQVAFVLSWIVAGALEPGYSHADQGISELGADDAANRAIVNAAIVVLGLAVAALGPAVLAVLPRRRAASVACFLFVAAGVAIALAGILPLDCGMGADERCEDLWRAGELSWQHDAHLWLSLVAQALFLATAFAIARALWPGTTAPAALGCGLFGIGLVLLAFVLYGIDGTPGGLVQRGGFVFFHGWVVIVAVGILHGTRRPPAPGELIPVRPRDFLAREWKGEGELLLRPFFLGRRFAQPFDARRRSTWISDSVFRLDDEARFSDGRVQRRQMFCEIVADDRLRVTGGDLPEGADVWLEEDGLRISPFRIAVPLGPLPLVVRCHDLSRVDADGTFANVTDVRTPALGIPLARVTFRMRPVDDASGPAPAGGRRAAAEQSVR